MTGIERPTAPPFAWAADMLSVGVTGTNGKTSTTHLIGHTFRVAGHHALVIGTVGYFLDEQRLELPRTLQGFYESLSRLHGIGGARAVIECTSKGLAMGYAKRWRFDLAVFTNLSADHLTTHGSWEHYLASKAQLFVHLGPGRTAVLNAADEHAIFLDQAVASDVHRRWFCSPTRGPALREADLAASSVEVGPDGTRIRLVPSAVAEALGGELSVQMVGEVFAENALAAALASLAAEVPAPAVVEGLASCPPVPGRFEVLARDPCVVVDYAHSADALARTCDTARRIAEQKVIVVFGAGGQSTPGKRIPMGEAVGRRADVAVITSDNPRDEDPQAIADMLVSGVAAGGRARAVLELDRRRAIECAIEIAGPDDVVIVAGKGHETGQVVQGQTLPFSDRDEVLRLTSDSSR